MDKAMELEKMLRENGVWCDVYPVIEDKAFAVEISWGDWKHDHLRAKWLMGEAGYIHTGEEVTEEDGSDTYSARHFFVA